MGAFQLLVRWPMSYIGKIACVRNSEETLAWHAWRWSEAAVQIKCGTQFRRDRCANVAASGSICFNVAHCAGRAALVVHKLIEVMWRADAFVDYPACAACFPEPVPRRLRAQL